MRPKSPNKQRRRVTIDLPLKALASIRKLKKETEADSMAEVVLLALEIYAKIVELGKGGKVICSRVTDHGWDGDQEEPC